MDTKQIKELLQKRQSGQLTDQEEAILDAWHLMLSKTETVEVDETDMIHRLNAAWAELEVNKRFPENKIYRLWPRIAATASIIITLSIGGYFMHYKKTVNRIAQLVKNNDIVPGLNQATLILANGQRIVLTRGILGKLAQQGHTIINATANSISYHNDSREEDHISYNTLVTARGEQSPYPLVLADGTKVLLNAQSSITFPNAFNGKERIVKLTGEAYFEVKHNNHQPFKVQANGQTIEDIGTTFNVNAYNDEIAIRTTLIEGSVKVNNLILKPGQQTDGNAVKTVNIARFTAWKDGDFNFDNDKITTVMRELGRWYNIEVVYQGKIPTDGFHAIISRKQNISAVLHGLENTKGVHFKIEGRRVTVIE